MRPRFPGFAGFSVDNHDVGTPLHQLIGPALEAARRALRDLEADQVPADLRKVARHGGALPPPLAASLVKGLDRYSWLREKALEAWPEGDRGGEAEDAAAVTFLQRKPGWVGSIASLAATRAVEEAAAGTSAAEAAAEAGREELKAAKTKMARERDAAERRIRDLERAIDEERKLRRIAQAGSARQDAGVQDSMSDLRAAADRSRDEATAAAATIRDLQEQLRDERRARAAAEAAATELLSAGGWSAVDAEDLAARLDDVARLARPAAASSDGAAAGSSPMCLPNGTRPDRPEAIEWLLSDAPPATVLIDGYNAGFLMTGMGNPAAARQRLELEAGRLVTLAAGRLAVVVVYDSDRGEGDRLPRRGGVEILFTSGRTADDVLVELAGELEGTRVVISNDRAVRERAERTGATALWSDALVAWGKAAR